MCTFFVLMNSTTKILLGAWELINHELKPKLEAPKPAPEVPGSKSPKLSALHVEDKVRYQDLIVGLRFSFLGFVGSRVRRL